MNVLRPTSCAVALLTAVSLAGCGGSSSSGSAASKSTASSSPSASAPAASTSSAPAASGSAAPAASTPSDTASGSSGTPAAAGSGTLTVFAAASLTGSFTTIGKAFEAAHPGTKVRFSFGASSALAQQILAGAPADVFASASPKNMLQVTSKDKAGASMNFAKNTAEIAVAPGSASKVHSLADLAKPGVKVALCQPQVPCGVLATKVLGNAKVTVKPVTSGLDVKSTLAYVTNGQVHAAVEYVTDVKAAGSKVVGVPVPAADEASTEYPIATVASSANSQLAQAFEDYVLSPAGQQVLGAAGFAKP